VPLKRVGTTFGCAPVNILTRAPTVLLRLPNPAMLVVDRGTNSSYRNVLNTGRNRSWGVSFSRLARRYFPPS